MKLLIAFIVLTSSLLNSIIAQPQLKKLWSSEKKFKTPESILYIPEMDQLFIANINGQPLTVDGNGFISTMSTDGTIGKLKWLTGFNAPKGMGYLGKKLYVTDITKVIEIDIPSAAITKRYTAEGAVFLNDIAIDAEGTLYISDYSKQNSCLYRLKNGKIEKWLASPEVSVPNGLFIADSILYVGSTGDGTLKTVNVKTKEVRQLLKPDLGIDGLKPFHGKGFFFSDWAGKTVFTDLEETVSVLINTTDEKINAADIEFIPEKKLLLVPTFFDDRVEAYEVVE